MNAEQTTGLHPGNFPRMRDVLGGKWRIEVVKSDEILPYFVDFATCGKSDILILMCSMYPMFCRNF